jgi:hypothetical protein
MISQEQIDILTEIHGLEWVDFVEYMEEDG